jgi:hypothetical protein
MDAAARHAFREGFVPLLSTKGLEALASALQRNDPRLIQGKTIDPPCLAFTEKESVEGAWAAMDGQRLYSFAVAELDWQFAKLCLDAGERLGDPAACRYLMNWIDDTPREEMRSQLLGEVVIALTARGTAMPAA